MSEQQFKTVPTRQFTEIIATLDKAQKNSSAAMIIAQTGMGKTYAVNTYCAKKTAHTYRIIVSDLYKKEDIIHELATLLQLNNLGLDMHWRKKNCKERLDAIAARLCELHTAGHKPMVIFDEAENMKITPLKMVKALYDMVKDRCSLVLIGTDQLMNLIYINKWKRNRTSLPQLYRRFKAGLKYVTPIDKEQDYTPFFELYRVPVGLQKLLGEISENYGDFMDYLTPALLECQAKKISLTEDYFRIKFNMPKTTIQAKK